MKKHFTVSVDVVAEVARHPRGQIAALDPNLCALYDPVLTWRVVIGMRAAKSLDVRVAPNDAGADGADNCWWSGG